MGLPFAPSSERRFSVTSSSEANSPSEASITIIRISAKTGLGIEELMLKLKDIIFSRMISIEKTIPYSDAGKIAAIRNKGTLLCEEYREDGIYIKAMIPSDVYIDI